MRERLGVRRRLVIVGVVLGVALLFVLACWSMTRPRGLRAKYLEVKNGMTRDQVIAILGQPRISRPENWWWEANRLHKPDYRLEDAVFEKWDDEYIFIVITLVPVREQPPGRPWRDDWEVIDTWCEDVPAEPLLDRVRRFLHL